MVALFGNEKIEVTVLLCCYNDANYLKKSIPSILNQSFKEFEFIIIDDGSIDETELVINKYKKYDKRIKYYKQDNIGLTKSLNRGINLSKGKYIARIDADDISYESRLEKQYNYLEKNKDIVLLGAQRIINDQINNKIFKDKLPITPKEIRKRAIVRNPFFHSLVMIRKDLFKLIGYYDESFQFVQDYELWSRVIHKYNTANLKDQLGEKIIDKAAISFRKDISFERSIYNIRARYRNYKNGTYPKYYFIYLLRPFFKVITSFPHYLKKRFYAR